MAEQDYIRPIKARCLRDIIKGYVNRTHSLGIRTLGSCTIVGRGQMPGINHSNDYIVDDCDYCACIVNEPSSAGGRVLYGGYLRSQWGHFLMNSTARLWPLFTGDVVDFDRIVFFSDRPDFVLEGNYARFFELVGLADKVEIVTSGSFSASEVIVPDISLEHPVFYSQEFMSPFDAVRCAVQGDRPVKLTRRVFMTRSALPGATKNEVGIRDIDRFFASNGFEVISPERMTLDELVKTLSESRVVASLSGSLAHNFVFAHPASEFIVVERTAVNNDYQVAIELAKGVEQKRVDAFRLPWPARSTGSVFLYSNTKCLRRFAAERGMVEPRFTLTPAREVRQFACRYRREYGYVMGLREFEMSEAPAVAEAVTESTEYYRPWLDGSRALFPADYLRPRYWLRRIKRLVKGR